LSRWKQETCLRVRSSRPRFRCGLRLRTSVVSI
jgi:hypothetical protein